MTNRSLCAKAFIILGSYLLLVSCTADYYDSSTVSGDEVQIQLLFNLDFDLGLRGKGVPPSLTMEESFSIFDHILDEEVELILSSNSSNYSNSVKFNPNDENLNVSLSIPYGTYNWSIADNQSQDPYVDYLFKYYLPIYANGVIEINSSSVQLEINVETDYGLITVEKSNVSSAKIINSNQYEKPLFDNSEYFYIYALESENNVIEVVENLYNTTISTQIDETGVITSKTHYNYSINSSEADVNTIFIAISPFSYKDFELQPNFGNGPLSLGKWDNQKEGSSISGLIFNNDNSKLYIDNRALKGSMTLLNSQNYKFIEHNSENIYLLKPKESQDLPTFEVFIGNQFVTEIILDKDESFDLKYTFIPDPVIEGYLVEEGFDDIIDSKVLTQSLEEIEFFQVWRHFYNIGKLGEAPRKALPQILDIEGGYTLDDYGDRKYAFNSEREKLTSLIGIEDFKNLISFRIEAVEIENIDLSYNSKLNIFATLFASSDINIRLPDKDLEYIWMGEMDFISSSFHIDENHFLTKATESVFLYYITVPESYSSPSSITGLENIRASTLNVQYRSIADLDLSNLKSSVKTFEFESAIKTSLIIDNNSLEILRCSYCPALRSVDIKGALIDDVSIWFEYLNQFNLDTPQLKTLSTSGELPNFIELEVPELRTINLNDSGYDSMDLISLSNSESLTAINVHNGQTIYDPDVFYMSSLNKFTNLRYLNISGFKEIDLEETQLNSYSFWKNLESLRMPTLNPFDYINLKGARYLYNLDLNVRNIDLTPLNDLPFIQVPYDIYNIKLNDRQIAQHQEMRQTGQFWVNNIGFPVWDLEYDSKIIRNGCFIPGTYTFEASELWGDGWNGAKLITYVNGSEIDQWSIPEGDLQANYSHSFSDPSVVISFGFVPGSKDQEIAFTIKDPKGNVIAQFDYSDAKPNGLIDCDCNN